MARTVVGEAVVVRQKYYWPDVQLNIWTIIMLVTAGTILGVFANFMMIQRQMGLGIPWWVFPPGRQSGLYSSAIQAPWTNIFRYRIFSYGVTVGALTIIVVIIEIVLVSQRRLLPGIMMLLSFILLVLFITGVIGTGIQLFGGSNVNNLCNAYVNNQKQTGPSVNTLAWLEQQSICKLFSHTPGLREPTGLITYRSKLECGICFLDHRIRFPGLDDGHGKPGQPEPVRISAKSGLEAQHRDGMKREDLEVYIWERELWRQIMACMNWSGQRLMASTDYGFRDTAAWE
jgi:hypothetical protein